MSTRRSEGTGVEILPFLIDWDNGAHPSDDAPAGLRLEGLRLVVPDPERAERILRAVGAEVVVEQGEQPALEAIVSSPQGHWVVTGAQDTTLNLYDFQSLMFRSLYYFGGKTTIEALNPTLSTCSTPRRQITGTTCPTGCPSQQPSPHHGVQPDLIDAQLEASSEPAVFTDDQLWEPVPFPMAWTKTTTAGAAGSGGCAAAPFGTADAQCKAVYTYLSEQAGLDPTKPTATMNAFSTYATNPLWQVVDGPFHLTSFTATGDVSMAVNSHYSGPNKPSTRRSRRSPTRQAQLSTTRWRRASSTSATCPRKM